MIPRALSKLLKGRALKWLTSSKQWVSETPTVTIEKESGRSFVVSRGVVHESPTVLTHVPDRRVSESPSARSHVTASRATSTIRSSAQDIVSSKPATTSQQLHRTDRAKQKGEARVERLFTLGVEAK